MRRLISFGVNHQLESRMQEICQSGSEARGEASFVPTPISALGGAQPGKKIRKTCSPFS